MEKMLLSKPPRKQARQNAQEQVQRTESVDMEKEHGVAIQEANDLPSTTPSDTMTEMEKKKQKAPSHPLGHKVHALQEVWDLMDQKDFLRLTDTPALFDVWVQPLQVLDPKGAPYVTVLFNEVVAGPEMKIRQANTKIAADELLLILYLCDKLRLICEGKPFPEYGAWKNAKTSAFVAVHGVEDSAKGGLIADFILTEDETFNFVLANSMMGLFVRKTCYHAYSEEGGEEVLSHVINPSMMKCKAKKGTFEYVYEARYLPMPNEWVNKEGEEKA